MGTSIKSPFVSAVFILSTSPGNSTMVSRRWSACRPMLMLSSGHTSRQKSKKKYLYTKKTKEGSKEIKRERER